MKQPKGSFIRVNSVCTKFYASVLTFLPNAFPLSRLQLWYSVGLEFLFTEVWSKAEILNVDYEHETCKHTEQKWIDEYDRLINEMVIDRTNNNEVTSQDHCICTGPLITIQA